MWRYMINQPRPGSMSQYPACKNLFFTKYLCFCHENRDKLYKQSPRGVLQKKKGGVLKKVF